MQKLNFDKEYAEMILSLPDNMEEYQYWLGLENRVIHFNDDVDMTAINKIIYWIRKWNEEDDKLGLEGKNRKEIRIVVSTNGGCVTTGMAILDTIKTSKTKIITEGIAVVASMGAYIFMAGHHRIAYPNTVILLHDGSLALQSTSKKAKNTMDFYDKLDGRLKQFVLDHSNISEELYDEKEDSEWYMFADEEGIELGIVDEIIK